MLHNRLPAALREHGFSEAQIAHAMREGGPLDEIKNRTWCDRCTRSIESTLRELLAANALCKCGGVFHIGISGRDIVEEIVSSLAPHADR